MLSTKNWNMAAMISKKVPNFKSWLPNSSLGNWGQIKQLLVEVFMVFRWDYPTVGNRIQIIRNQIWKSSVPTMYRNCESRSKSWNLCTSILRNPCSFRPKIDRPDYFSSQWIKKDQFRLQQIFYLTFQSGYFLTKVVWLWPILGSLFPNLQLEL